MADPLSPYLFNLRKAETRSLLKGLIPAVVWSYRLRRRYRKAFPDAFVSSGALVALDAQIGPGCIVRTGCSLAQTVTLGRYSTLGDNCLLRGSGRIEIGPFCSIGPEVVIISENHAFERPITYPLGLYFGKRGVDSEFIPSEIVVGADVWIGQRAIILAGAHIGVGCVIAAGSVVPRGDYKPFTLLAGVPAHPIKKRLDESSRQALLDSKWWTAPTDELFGEWISKLQRPYVADSRRADGS